MKLTSTQRQQIKLVKKAIQRERRYIPMGQGDGFNQDLKIKNLDWIIDQIKAGEDMHQTINNRGLQYS